MKSAKEGQFHELIAKLLTRTDYSGMDADEIQKLINDPQRAASIFVYMVNHVSKLHFKNLRVADLDKKVIIDSTEIAPGDTLVFDTFNRKVQVIRDFGDGSAKGVYFRFEEQIPKEWSYGDLENTHEILEACAVYGCLIDCKTITDVDEQRHSIKVKFEFF